MKKKSELRSVPVKNYVILAVIAVVTILLTFYINAWIKTYKANAYSESVLSGEIKEVNINELKEPFYEVNEVVLYVGYTDDENLYASEKKLLRLIKKEDLKDSVMYLNVTGEDNYISVLEKRFGNSNVKFGKAPLLIYITNSQTEEVKVITDVKKLPDTFEKMIEKHKIGSEY